MDNFDSLQPYQLKTSFVAAVREGNNVKALGILDYIVKNESTSTFQPNVLNAPGWVDGQRTPLVMALDPDMHPGVPVDLDFVRALLDMGSAVDAVNPQQTPPLEAAVRSGNLAAVELLLERGANPNVEHGYYYMSLLATAIGTGHTAIALRLLEVGADPNGSPAWSRPLQAAARQGDVVVAKALIERGADVNAWFPNSVRPHTPFSTPFSPSTTALEEAASNRESAVLALLLQSGADANLHSEMGGTALHRACYLTSHTPESGFQNVRLLLEAGADPNAADQSGSTPLCTLLMNGFQLSTPEMQTAFHNTLELLLRYNANVNIAQLWGSEKREVTPLMQAVAKRDAGSVVLLLRAGAHLEATETAQLWLLAQEGKGEFQSELARMLHERGISSDAESQTAALFPAIMGGELERVVLLLNNGANLHQVDDKGRTPLHWAAKYNYPDIVGELLQRGANPNAQSHTNAPPLLESVARGDRTPNSDERRKFFSHLPELHGGEDPAGGGERQVERNTAWIATQSTETVRTLLAAGANVRLRANGGNTALHKAVQRAVPPVIKLLLEAGALVNERDDNNSTPLNLLLIGSRRERLLQNNQYIRAYQTQQTPTHDFYSVREGRALLRHAIDNDIVVLRLLLEHGADPNLPGFNGYLPLHLAAFYGTPEMVQMLLDAGADPNGLVKGYSAFQYIFTKGRTCELLKCEGFTLEQFPGIREYLMGSAFSQEQSSSTLILRGGPELQAAACEDVAVLRILAQAGDVQRVEQ